MDEKNEVAEKNNIDDFMLPGFRFHPTDEELVGFYLKRKLQQRPLPIELIKQVDIYKYDPWDLPKLVSTGEKEWYFYCPRDRKYRNSTRPNRVTGSGFWKATGTDRPIYSSEGNKCIGLKKSLVFYRGRAAKGLKTDWMMHEFRLPSTVEGGASMPSKKILDKNFLATDSWAICRIFKKTNSTVNRALSHPWIASLSETSSPPPDHVFTNTEQNQTHFNSETVSSTIESEFQPANFSGFNIPSYRSILPIAGKPQPIFTTTSNGDIFPGNFLFSHPEEVSAANSKNSADLNSMLFSLSPEFINMEEQVMNGFSNGSSQLMQPSISQEQEQGGLRKNENVHSPWGNIRSIGFPFSLPWDSPTCPSEISSTNYHTNMSHAS